MRISPFWLNVWVGSFNMGIYWSNPAENSINGFLACACLGAAAAIVTFDANRT